MANFCGKCGARLDVETGLCPNCDREKLCQTAENTGVPAYTSAAPVQSVPAQPMGMPVSGKEEKKRRKAERKIQKKAAKKARKKEKWASLTFGEKILKIVLRMLLCVILLVVLGVGLLIGAVYFDILDVSSVVNSASAGNVLDTVTEKTVVVEQEEIIMYSETAGRASVIVQIPDYEALFQEAYESGNPQLYLITALTLDKYETKKYRVYVDATVEDGEIVLHSEEVVNQILEQELIQAINNRLGGNP